MVASDVIFAPNENANNETVFVSIVKLDEEL
jgi:hypothetical protein